LSERILRCRSCRSGDAEQDNRDESVQASHLIPCFGTVIFVVTSALR
jgi:hypothetical protein